MIDLSFTLLAVADPLRSADFYARLLGLDPVERGPTFVLFVLRDGHRLGLWSHATLHPPVTGAPAGTSELAADVSDIAAALAVATGAGGRIVWGPERLDFGTSVLVLDPDGHRIRIMTLADATKAEGEPEERENDVSVGKA